VAGGPEELLGGKINERKEKKRPEVLASCDVFSPNQSIFLCIYSTLTLLSLLFEGHFLGFDAVSNCRPSILHMQTLLLLFPTKLLTPVRSAAHLPG
jgi:hypothetical protein